MTLGWLEALLRSHGLLLMAPLALLEGPIVTVIAGALARAEILSVAGVYAVAVLADLVGDSIVYWLGRQAPRLPLRWRTRLGLGEARLDQLGAHFRARGAVTLVIGKLTHSAGFAVLAAAGAARMPFGPFLAVNVLATLPKAGLFLAIGYFVGAAYTTVDRAIFVGSLSILAVLAILWAGFRILRRWSST